MENESLFNLHLSIPIKPIRKVLLPSLAVTSLVCLCCALLRPSQASSQHCPEPGLEVSVLRHRRRDLSGQIAFSLIFGDADLQSLAEIVPL